MKKPAASLRIPSLWTVPFLKTSDGSETVVLTERQREKLLTIATRLRFPARATIYREGSEAEWVFAIAEGMVKSYRELPSGKRNVVAFLFTRDLFGLAVNGQYLNTVQAVTPVTVYRLPVDALAALLKHDGEMQFRFLAKVTHELRESQRRAILINRRDAVGRLAMFVALMGDRLGAAIGVRAVPLPMTRSDIAGFLGLSLESVSRAANRLERRGLVRFENRHLARIVDPGGLARLVAAV